MRKFTQSLALAALLLSTSAYAQNVAPATSVAAKAAKVPWLYEGSDVPVDDSWTFGVLPNGLRYAVKKNDVPAGQVSIRVRIDAGALHENNDEQGFAHLIEHLSFRGSTFVPDGEAKRIWQRFGVTFGSDSNAQQRDAREAGRVGQNHFGHDPQSAYLAQCFERRTRHCPCGAARK
ncbi:MAG: insulinase family protein [Sphingomonadaceae bacterium]|uniref:insulinase family protein n=1 Tax=Sphingorhabdus sp. TaxID=1902408 RepID=UPI0039BD246F|nr:insulinase family protein [Sphingomonadaceae bacterium]